ncbi:MAG TPA: alkaline phosphatase family protein [Anaerolineaceae bacterium]|nr:alkaline phosphatase family protein [Anaerolineaceae bacterium]
MGDRVLIIGLDGATWTVLSPWIEDGTLPNLARLRNAGCWGELRSTLPPLTAPAWSSFLTGKNPGKHGVFHFVPLDDGADGGSEAAADKPGLVDARSIQSPTLWDILAHQGKKIGSINVPMSYPPRPVNGFMITCLLTPPNAAVFTYPPELSQRLDGYQIDLDRFIDQKPFARDEQGVSQKRVVKPSLQLVEEFFEMEEIRARTALDLMDTQPWDVFMVVFTATDRMGHYLWPYHQRGDGTPEGDSIHQGIRRLYQRLDEHIGALVEKAGDGTSVVIMSDHGMGPIYTRNTHWNNWLYKNGYLRVAQSSQKTLDGWLLRLGIPRDRIRALAHRIPGLAKSRVAQKARGAQTAQIDRQHSRAYYARIFDPVGGIFVNATGEEREQLIEELMGKLRELTDPVTGESIIRQLLRREECFHGPYVQGLPDIILLMHPQYGSSDRLSNYSAIVTERPELNDPGGHHMEGIFIASGQGVVARPEPLVGLQIEDIAPTVLYLMGLPIPKDMDGRELVEITAIERNLIQPLLRSEPHERWPSDAEAQPILETVDGGEEIIYERLRALGYMK